MYYAGHGFGGEKDGLKIAAIDEGNGHYGDPQAFFPDVMQLLNIARSDVLLIVDCCYAAKAFSRERYGRQKFELLASSTELSPAPGKGGSFTAALIDTLKSLLGDSEHKQGFSTSTLYRRLYHHPDLQRYKPLLFDQSHFDQGKIWLRPHKSSPATETPVYTSDVAIDLKLHLSLTKYDKMEFVGLAMNELAMKLQYLPHVHHIDFKELYAGDDDVKKFLDGVTRATIVKEVIRRLKNRVKERKKQRLLQHEAAKPAKGPKRSASFHQYVLKNDISLTQDWGSTEAKFTNGTVVPKIPVISNLQRSPSQPKVATHQRRRAFQVPGILYITYILDFTGIWIAVSRFFYGPAQPTPEQRSKATLKYDDGPQANSSNAQLRPEVVAHESNSFWEWKYHRQSPLILERIFWLVLLLGICTYGRHKICDSLP